MAQDPKITWTALGRTLNDPGKTDTPIPITEYPRSFSMDDGDQPYGIPVDAPLGVKMIKDLWDRLNNEMDPKEFSEWIKKLLRQSFAFGLDKNVLLKTLSQPKCEGLRFYLCLRPAATELKEVLSLVTVGVDAEGKDLFFEYDPTVHKSGIENIETQSLLAEYGYPPGGGGLTAAVDMDPFVLFKYSQ